MRTSTASRCWQARHRATFLISGVTSFLVTGVLVAIQVPAQGQAEPQAPPAAMQRSQGIVDQQVSPRVSLTILPADEITVLSPGRAMRDIGSVTLLDRKSDEIDLALRNDTGGTITLGRISAPCGCLTAVASSGSGDDGTLPTLQPGEETKVRVTLDLAALAPGSLKRTVAVYAQGYQSPVATLDITGTLLSLATFSPAVLDFGKTEPGETRSLTVTASIDSRIAPDGVIPPLFSSSQAVRITPLPEQAALSPSEPVGAGARTMLMRTYRVSLIPDAPLGPIHGRIGFVGAQGAGSVVAATPARPAAAPGSSGAFTGSTALVVGQVAGGISAQPAVVAFGSAAAGREAMRQVQLTVADAGLLVGARVLSASPYVNARLKEDLAVSGAPGHAIEVTLTGGAPVGPLSSELKLTLANGQRLLIPVTGYVRTPESR